MRVSIEQHHSRRLADLRAAADRATKRRSAATARIDAAKGRRDALVKERETKRALRTQAAEEGLDSSKLDAKLLDLDARVAALDADVARLEAELAGLPCEPAFDAERMRRLEESLRRLGCADAEEVEGIAGCIAALPRAEVDFDGSGRPTCASVRLDAERRIAVNVKPGRRLRPGFIPEVLRWVPRPDTTSARQEPHDEGSKVGRVRAFVDRGSGQLIVTEVALACVATYETVDYSDVATGLAPLLAGYVEAAGSCLDLEHEYADNPLMERIRSDVVAQTTANPPFPPCSDRPDSPTIYGRIRTEWDALAAAPWSEFVDGPLALLKYHLEGGERARFWSQGFEGAYGFRLRTRDHDWIKGSICLQQAAEGAVDASEIRTFKGPWSSSGSTRFAALGRLCIRVERSED